MRLSKRMCAFLIEQIREKRSEADIYLFGSRADDTLKGGDIDILVLDEKPLGILEKINVQVAFNKAFGEQKLDIVSYNYDDREPFKCIALETAVPLIFSS